MLSDKNRHVLALAREKYEYRKHVPIRGMLLLRRSMPNTKQHPMVGGNGTGPSRALTCMLRWLLPFL